MSEFEDIAPRPDAMVASMRAIGYDLPMAIADIIDNSIYAKAGRVWIDYGWDEGKPWIRITDDGVGMTEEELREAMRLGSRGPWEEREPDDLGRFGLGLKTASFSQCRVFTVRAKTADGRVATRCWNLDIIEDTNEWRLCLSAPQGSEGLLEVVDDLEQGTTVVWQGLDRVVDDIDDPEDARRIFYDKFNEVSRHIEMVFHRYMTGPGRLRIFVGRVELKPWDPFLTSNSFTQELSTEKYEDGSVKIVPYVLPHVSKRNDIENELCAGPRGWNAQQGFYIYRNRRMIVSGGYLDFNLKSEEHYKLARIMVDLKNCMDDEWRIDVRKASVIPPDRLRPELMKVARATRAEAVKVYRARLGRKRPTEGERTQDVWVKRRKGDKVVYEVNRENEVIKRFIETVEPPKSWLNRLFGTLESTIPHREIIIDNCDDEDCHVDLPPDLVKPDQALIDLCIELYRQRRSQGRPHKEAVELITAIEPFNVHPAYRAALDGLVEGKK